MGWVLNRREIVWAWFLRGLRVVVGPDSLKLVQMVGAQHGPVSSQVLKVIHDDSDEQIDNLSEKDRQRIYIPENLV